MEDFWYTLKVICSVIFVSPAIVALIMIATGNGSSSGSKAGSWKEKRIEYEKQRNAQERLNNQTIRSTTIPLEFQRDIAPTYKSYAPTPDDAYDEGYDSGYEQGVKDGQRGRCSGSGYDNSNSYYNHYETMYEEGYESGYDEGYRHGRSWYEDNEEDIYL